MIDRDFKRVVFSITLMLMTCLLLTGCASSQIEGAQQQPDVIGAWADTLNVPASKLKLWCGYLWNEIPIEYFGRG